MSIDKARDAGLLTQKDLADALGVSSIRTVQRMRHKYGLEPVDTYGNNPLFRPEDVERVREARRVHMLALNRKRRGQKVIGGILTLKQIRKKAEKKRRAAR